jgi:hypothetical protein
MQCRSTYLQEQLVDAGILPPSYPVLYGEQATKFKLPEHEKTILEGRIPYAEGFPQELSRCPSTVWQCFSKGDSAQFNRANDELTHTHTHTRARARPPRC